MNDYDTIWEVMNDVEEAFSQISTITFLTNQIQHAINTDDTNLLHDCTHALIAFVPTYEKNFDEKFMKAWEKVVVPLHKNKSSPMSYQEICKYLKSQSPEVYP